MACIVCHRSVGTQAKKCSFCGAPTALSKGEFLFKMNSADEKQLKKYYDQWQESQEKAHEVPDVSSKPAIPTARIGTGGPMSRALSEPIAYKSGGFISDHGFSILKYMGYAAFIWTLIIVVARIKISAMLLVILASVLVFSAYLIYSQICYTTKRSIIFWVCTAVSIIIAITSYISGKNATEWANNTVMAWADYAKSSQLDIVQHLLGNYSSTFTTAMAMTFSIPAWLNIPLVNYELKNTTKNKVLAICGILLFIWEFYAIGSTLGNYMVLKREILNYCATAFPDQMIIFS